jgi:hypothetical protein
MEVERRGWRMEWGSGEDGVGIEGSEGGGEGRDFVSEKKFMEGSKWGGEGEGYCSREEIHGFSWFTDRSILYNNLELSLPSLSELR